MGLFLLHGSFDPDQPTALLDQVVSEFLHGAISMNALAPAAFLLSLLATSIHVAQADETTPLLSLDAARKLESTLVNEKNVAVTPENFAFAVLDESMQNEVKLGATNKFYNHRKPMELDK